MRFRRPTVDRPEWLYGGRFVCGICGWRGRTWSSVFMHVVKEHDKDNPRPFIVYKGRSTLERDYERLSDRLSREIDRLESLKQQVEEFLYIYAENFDEYRGILGVFNLATKKLGEIIEDLTEIYRRARKDG